MLSKVSSGAIMGIEAYSVDVEVDVAPGLPSFSVIGLPDAAIRESRDRIRSAIKNSGYSFPAKRITVNLSPAGIRKEGSGFDLPIAIGILSAAGLLDQEDLKDILFSGELSLNGVLKNIRGALPLAISLKDKYKAIILPKISAMEAVNIEGIPIYGVNTLIETLEHLKGIKPVKPLKSRPLCVNTQDTRTSIDYIDVKGQEYVKRGLEVAAAGGHNILLLGPPGAGKSMLAKRFSTILPDISLKESLETTKIYSIRGLLKSSSLMSSRPFRAPHHTISFSAMTGGGMMAGPGEISLANNGVLFLDEFPEFRRDVIESLRQPMESGEITVIRSQKAYTYPSRFIFIAAMNPCPCGYFTDPKKECRCSPYQIQRYLSKVSGPLLDRIDIHLEVPRLNYDELSSGRRGAHSRDIRERVNEARELVKKRFKENNMDITLNSDIPSSAMEKFCTMSKEAGEILKSAILELGISARAYDKILKISRTIADMDKSDIIGTRHISEAIGYRYLDKSLWL